MLNRIAVYLPDDLKSEVMDELSAWRESNKIERVWKKDATVWTNEDESKWLGWLDIVDEELAIAEQYRDF